MLSCAMTRKIFLIKSALVTFVLLTGLFCSFAFALGFKVTLDKSVVDKTLEGRLYIIVTQDDSYEPRDQVSYYAESVPFWGKDVTLRPGQTVTMWNFDSQIQGFPLESFNDLPEGDYTVQAFLNVYTTFTRSDGSVVKLHMPCGSGHYQFDSPGNIYSDAQSVMLQAGSEIELTLTNLITPSEDVPEGGTCQQGNPTQSEHVKRLKLKSDVLSEFWGQDMYIAADVLLPQGYDENPDAHYPVIYVQGHYLDNGDNPFGFSEDLDNEFSKWWMSDEAPSVIAISLRHETPFFDDSYGVDSANVGPYGTAITQELMPALDTQFRTVGQRWARTLTGCSTGGWIAIAHMVLYPDLYAGVFSIAPDPIDFRYFELVNIYEDTNAYFRASESGWVNAPRPSTREVDGETVTTMAQENLWELALGTNSRSGLGNWDIWQAVYGPRGEDGYPAPIWDKVTGDINPEVAEAWKNYDLREIVVNNWATLADKLAGRIHLYAADDDDYFLENGVKAFEEGTSELNPPLNATFVYSNDAGHCTVPFTNPYDNAADLVNLMTDFMIENAPADADMSWRK
jgi:enterochelin esterase-like enzyme